MSFLTPLYLLAGLAVALPIVFHLIRQTPRGRQVFSTVMFLSPSPPRMTQRSRIEHWLLLLLRALAVICIAIAFARPFWRTDASAANDTTHGRTWMLLIDTSASMQRGEIWDEVQQRVVEVLADVETIDSVALATFDTGTSIVLPFDEWNALPPQERTSTAQQRLDEIEPTWRGTNLGDALQQAAELVDVEDESATARYVVLISDLQEGCRWESLQGYTWPDSVEVQLERVGVDLPPTNAGLIPLDATATRDDIVRVRVSNSELADREAFTLEWLSEASERSPTTNNEETLVTAYVPPGQSRVVHAPARPSDDATALRIAGDDHDFDNIASIAPRRPWPVRIVTFGRDTADDPDGLRYFLPPLFPETRDRTVELVDWPLDASEPPLSGEDPTLLIVTAPPAADQLEWIHTWTELGGCTLFVLQNAEAGAALAELLDLEGITVTEAEQSDYAMLGKVDFDHPIFRPFDDPRFSNFTALKFWQHRIVEGLPDDSTQIIAAFDDGSPAIWEHPLGQGRVLVFTSSWNRADSDLALWSKFVPLMNQLLEYGGRKPSFQAQRTTGQTLRKADLGYDEETDVTGMQPDGTSVSLTGDGLRLEQPGLYRFSEEEDATSSEPRLVAVNLPPDESRTAPLDLDVLEATGLKIDGHTAGDDTSVAGEEDGRQLLARELESRQQWWRWVLIAALLILFVETVLANWMARRAAAAR